MKSNIILIFSFVLMVFNFKSQEIKNTLPWRKVSIVDSYFGQTKTTYKRQLLQERIFMILLNITRVSTLHQPLVSLGTFRLNKGAYLHSIDMAQTNKFAHYNFDNRSDEFQFNGENIIFNHRGAFSMYWGWMNSEGHRKNMMNWGYFFTGLGFCKKKQITYFNNKKRKKEKVVSFYGTQVFR